MSSYKLVQYNISDKISSKLGQDVAKVFSEVI